LSEFKLSGGMTIMGTWAYGIFDDDITLDLKDVFEEYIEEGLSVPETTKRTLEKHPWRFKVDDPRVYLAIASLQIEHGELQKDVKQAALDIIESGKDLVLKRIKADKIYAKVNVWKKRENAS
jgi:hypothetical protein